MPKLKVWITRTFRPKYPPFSETCIHTHKPVKCGLLDGGAGWSGEWPNHPVPLPKGKHLGLKPGECKRAILTIE